MEAIHSSKMYVGFQCMVLYPRIQLVLFKEHGVQQSAGERQTVTNQWKGRWRRERGASTAAMTMAITVAAIRNSRNFFFLSAKINQIHLISLQLEAIFPKRFIIHNNYRPT
jgi:hypothetical protein